MSFGNEPAPRRMRHTRPAGSASAARQWAGWSLAAAVLAVATVSLGFGTAGCGGGGGGGGTNPSPSPSASITTVTGRIVDGNGNSQPVAGATVSFGGQSATTGADGSFTLTYGGQAVSAGSLSVSVGGSYYSILRTSTGVCAGSLAVPISAVTAGQTYNVGTVTVYSQGTSSPPPAPCLGS